MEAGPTLEEPELLSLADDADGDQEFRDRSTGLPLNSEMAKKARELEMQYTVGYVTAGAHLLVVGVPALCGDDGGDGTTLRYLLKKGWALKKKKEEEEQETRSTRWRAARLRRGEGKRGRRRNFLRGGLVLIARQRHAPLAPAACSIPGLRGSSGGDSRLFVRYCRKLERLHWWSILSCT